MNKKGFVLADRKRYVSDIYTLWKEISLGTRLLGLKDSLSNGFVYVYLYDGKVCGFVRFNLSGKTLDYLRFNEICCIHDSIVVIRSFFRDLDVLIFKLGFVKAKIVAVNSVKEFLLNSGMWQQEDMKYTQSKTNRMYDKFGLARNLYGVNINKKYFGSFLLERKNKRKFYTNKF